MNSINSLSSISSTNIKQLFSRYKIMALLIAIAIIWAFFSWKTEGGFVTPRNLSNLLRQMSVTGILACGMVLVIIAGEIDLSVGSLLGLLGGILAFRGVLLGVTGGLTIAPVSSELVYLGQGYLPQQLGVALVIVLFVLALVLTWRQRVNRVRHSLPVHALWRDAVKVLIIGGVLLAFVRTLNSYDGIPVPVLLLLALLGLFSYITTQTVFGRRIYSVGSNMEATRLSGVNVQSVKLWVFGIMGVMCALAGLINTARLAAGSPSSGSMGELDAIAACFIGGTSMRGGSGTIYGALIGALVMASLDNGMSMLDVGTYWQMIVKGSILMLAVWVNVSTRSGR